MSTLKRRLLKHIIDDVPPEIAACESDCRSTRCGGEHFATCQLRLEVAAALQDVPTLQGSACEAGIHPIS